jgi:hypothetical protein
VGEERCVRGREVRRGKREMINGRNDMNRDRQHRRK